MIGGTCGAGITALRMHLSRNFAVNSRRFVELPGHPSTGYFKSSCQTTGIEISLLMNSNLNYADRPGRTRRVCPTGTVHIDTLRQLVGAGQ